MFRLGLLAAGGVVAVLAYRVQVDDYASPADRALAIVAVGIGFVFAGVAAWERRPLNRLGPLMILTGFALLARQLRYSEDPLTFTVFFALGEIGYALFAHSALAYPSGRVLDRVDRAFLGAAYGTVVLFPLATLMLYDGTGTLRYVRLVRESVIAVDGDMGTVAVLEKAYVIFAYGVLASLFVLLIARKLWRASARRRRVLAPLLLAAVATAMRAVFECVLMFWTPPPSFVVDNLFWWQIGGFIAMPVALLVGLLTSRLAQASVGDLVLRLQSAQPGDIQAELARALQDPSLEVAFWLPERGEFVDARGAKVTVPADGERAVTHLGDGEPLAALVHDPGLRDEPELVAAACAAARLALENARLHAEVHAQLAKVKESRARLAAAADEERRRIERDLHDGAQQRLVALAVELREAQGEVSDPIVERLLDGAVGELQGALSELRELARGIHPSALTEGGLDHALESLRLRSPLQLTVESNVGRLAPNVEATAYFLACEALTNAAKHARAQQVAIDARLVGERLVVDVADDGVGGARMDGGTGLRGLADRVEALGGTLRLESPQGGGTRVTGEIPCAS